MMIDKPVTNDDSEMTRFKYVWENISDPAIYDTITGNFYFINDEDDIERIVGLLNNLHQEKQQLNMSPRCDSNEIESMVKEIHCLKEGNEQLQKKNKILEEDVNDYHNALFDLQEKYDKLEKGNERLRKKLECCEYSHFLNELDEIHKKIDEGDLSDFSPLKEDKTLKEKLYYWQCKYYRRDYEHKMDMCTRGCNYGGLLNYCLKDKCDKMVKRDYEVTITEFKNGMGIGWKKRGWIRDE